MDTPLKLARKRRNLTQVQVAAVVGMEASFYGRVENGEKKVSTPMAKKLAACFSELTRDQILFPEEYVVPPAPAIAPPEA